MTTAQLYWHHVKQKDVLERRAKLLKPWPHLYTERERLNHFEVHHRIYYHKRMIKLLRDELTMKPPLCSQCNESLELPFG